MTTLYLIQIQYSHAIGSGWVAVDTSRAVTLDDLRGGQFDRPLRVLEVIPDEGTARDVSEDIARDLAALREPLSEGVMLFIEEHCGTALVQEMEAA